MGSGGIALPFLTSALYGCQWSTPLVLYHLVFSGQEDGWARASMNNMEKTNISCPCKESNPDSLVIQSVDQLLYCPRYSGSINQSTALYNCELLSLIPGPLWTYRDLYSCFDGFQLWRITGITNNMEERIQPNANHILQVCKQLWYSIVHQFFYHMCHMN
jgi:hypothetical protein